MRKVQGAVDKSCAARTRQIFFGHRGVLSANMRGFVGNCGLTAVDDLKESQDACRAAPRSHRSGRWASASHRSTRPSRSASARVDRAADPYHGGDGQGRVPRTRDDGCSDGRQPGACRLPGHRLEPDAGARTGAGRPRGRDGAHPGGGRRRHADRRHLRVGHPGRRVNPFRRGRRLLGGPLRTLVIDCSQDRPVRQLGFRARLRERGCCGCRCAGVRRSERSVGRPQRDPDDLRRGHERTSSTRVRSSRARPDDHARRPGGAASGTRSTMSSWPARTGGPRCIVLAIKAGPTSSGVVGTRGGAAQSWVLANRSGRMIANDYPLGFRCRSTARTSASRSTLAGQLGALVPVQRAGRSWERVDRQRTRDDDMSALARAIRGLSNLDD